MTYPVPDALTLARLRALIAEDLRCAVDDGDLARRLARNGYGYADAPGGRRLVTLPHGVDLMALPQAATL